jgi:hypothetical protein
LFSHKPLVRTDKPRVSVSESGLVTVTCRTSPSTTFLYREAGAGTWIEEIDGEFQGVEGTSYEIACTESSTIRTITIPTDSFLAGGIWHSEGDYVWDTSLTWSIS